MKMSNNGNIEIASSGAPQTVPTDSLLHLVNYQKIQINNLIIQI